MLRKMKIGSKMIWMVSLLIVSVAAGIGITTYFQASNALSEQVETTITNQAHEAAVLVRSELDKYLLIGRELAENPSIKSMDLETQMGALDAMSKRYGFLGMGVIEFDGTAYYPDGTQAALGDRAYFREAMSGTASFSDVLISRVTNSPVMILAVPITDSRSVPVAALLIRLDAGWLSEITDRIGYGESGYSYMIDGTGALIAHDERDYVLNQRNFLEEGKTNPDFALLSDMLQRMTEGDAGYEEYSFMGSVRFFGYAPVERSDWSIAVGGYRNEIFRRVDEMRSTTMLIALAFIAIGIVAAVLFARTISKPINTLVAGADRLAVGDIQVTGVDPKEIVKITARQDELGVIGRAFNSIIDYQKEKVAIAEQIASKNLSVESSISSEQDVLGKAFSEMVDSLNDILGQVQVAIEQVAAGAGQVSSASQDLSQGATESASSLEEITSSINQISSQSRQTMDNSAEANNLAQQAATDAKNGQGQMGELREAMGSISEASGEISKIVKVIDDIAFQINLLALNANVEAARAGKYGKGFAVVAEEVRNLAVRAADAVKETTGMVERSVDSIETGVQHTSKTAEQLESIVAGAERVSQFLDELAASSKEQSLAIDQITEGLGQVDQVTQSNTASAEESASASEELSSQAEQLRSSISVFKLKLTGTGTRSIGDTAARAAHAQRRPQHVVAPAKSAVFATTADKNGNGTHRQSEEVIQLDDDEFDRF